MIGKTFAFFDIETTGFNVVKNEIIEIGVVLAKMTEKGMQIIEELEIKVKPEHLETADKGALAINGYNEVDWMFAYSLNQAIKIFSEKTEGAILVAHNLSFDWSFIIKASYDCGIEIKSHYHRIDTLSLAFMKFSKEPDINKFSLKALCNYYEIKNDNAHTALSDSRATLKVFEKLLGL